MGQHTSKQSDGGHLWIDTPGQTPEVMKDSITSYAGYFADSLNSSLSNNTFRFELKEIILPQEIAKSESSKPIYPSILYPEKFDTGEISVTNRHFSNFDWLTLLLILSLGLFTWVHYNFKRRLRQIFSATWAPRYIGQLIRDGHLEKEGIAPALGLISLVSYSILFFGFVGEVAAIHLTGGRLWASFLLISITLLVLRVSRRLAARLIGHIFGSWPATNIYLLNGLLFSFTSGVLLFPFSVVWVYTNERYLLYAGVSVAILTWIIRLFRNLFSGLQVQSFSGFYIFLYFCTLEILPVAIGLKIYKILSW